MRKGKNKCFTTLLVTHAAITSKEYFQSTIGNSMLKYVAFNLSFLEEGIKTVLTKSSTFNCSNLYLDCCNSSLNRSRSCLASSSSVNTIGEASVPAVPCFNEFMSFSFA